MRCPATNDEENEEIMDLSGWNHLQHHTEEGPFISAASVGGPDRTLLEGYDVERNDFTVELIGMGTEIAVEYTDLDGERRYETKAKWYAESLVPNKRTYASRTDLSFAMLLKVNGISPTYIDIPTENKD